MKEKNHSFMSLPLPSGFNKDQKQLSKKAVDWDLVQPTGVICFQILMKIVTPILKIGKKNCVCPL